MGCACIRQDVVVKNQKLFIDRGSHDVENNNNNQIEQNNNRPSQDELILRPLNNNLARNFELINQANLNNNEPFLQSRTNANFNFPEIGKNN
jgi:hypothetical protein